MASKIYTLGYTGAEVDQAIEKIQNLDLTTLSGGIITLESSLDHPYNLNFLRVVGLYMADYVYGETAPSGVDQISPCYIYVSKVNDGTSAGKLIQSLHAGASTYSRFSTDGGGTWSVWECNDVSAQAIEITREEVDAIFNEIFGDAMISDVAYTLLTTNAAVASAQSTTAKTSTVSRTSGVAT